MFLPYTAVIHELHMRLVKELLRDYPRGKP